MKSKIIYVEWYDSASVHGWQETDTYYGMVTCKSVGFLVKSTKKKLVLALNASVTGNTCPWGDLIIIPRCCIIKEVRL